MKPFAAQYCIAKYCMQIQEAYENEDGIIYHVIENARSKKLNPIHYHI